MKRIESLNDTFLKIKSHETTSLIYLFASAFVFFQSQIVGITRYLSYVLLGRSDYGIYLYVAVVILLAVLMALFNEKLVLKKYLISFAVYVLLILISYFSFPSTRQYFVEYRTDLLFNAIIGLFGFAIFSNLEKIEKLYTPLLLTTRILAVIMPILYFTGIRNLLSDMEWGNKMYVVSLIYFFLLKQRTSKKQLLLDVPLFVFSFFFSLLGGRQSLAFLVLGMLLIVIFSNDSITKRIITILVVTFAALIIIVLRAQLLSLLSEILSAFNIESRGLETLSDSSFLDFSNRNSIYDYSIHIIETNLFRVSGIFGDRFYLRAFRSNIAYAHNIFLELLIDFGLFFGIAIIALFVFALLHKFVFIKDKYRLFYIVIVIVFLAKFLVSSSIFIDTGFIIFSGFLLNKGLDKKKIKHKSLIQSAKKQHATF